VPHFDAQAFRAANVGGNATDPCNAVAFDLARRTFIPLPSTSF
jgi:hypothetical protein